ncbi:MAG: glycine cleavage system protein GcvH [Elusimicrobia bacterium]|nr:glycine cleavage system protein GcvH [Elusimicrobiota bacterium]
MFNPEICFYAKSHEWAHVDGDTATAGISDHAQHEITDVVYVELPQVGRVVEQGKPCAVVESVKAAFDVYSPFSGEISEVNAELASHPEWVNQAPHGQGWFFKVRLAKPGEKENLMSFDQYREFIKTG